MSWFRKRAAVEEATSVVRGSQFDAVVDEMRHADQRRADMELMGRVAEQRQDDLELMRRVADQLDGVLTFKSLPKAARAIIIEQVAALEQVAPRRGLIEPMDLIRAMTP